MSVEQQVREFAEKVNKGEPNAWDPANQLKGQGVEHIMELLNKLKEKEGK